MQREKLKIMGNNEVSVNPTVVIQKLLEQDKVKTLEIAKRDALIESLNDKVQQLTKANKELDDQKGE